MNEEVLQLIDELAQNCVSLNIEATKEVRKIRDRLRNDIWNLVREFREKSGIKEEQFWSIILSHRYIKETQLSM